MAPPDDPAKQPSVPEPDEVLEIELEDLPEETPKPAVDGTVLDITLDEPEATTPSAGSEFPAATEFPSVTEADRQAANSVTVSCGCSLKGSGFEVRFEERTPGEFWAAEAKPLSAKAAKGAGAGQDTFSQVQGAFRMGPEFGCPFCGCKAMMVCDCCGLVVCEGGLDATKACVCPGCGEVIELSGLSADTVQARGRWGKKSKG